MTKLIKRKGLLSLMAVVVMVAMMSVACKNRVTGMSLSAEPEVANPSEVLEPDGKLAIDKNRGLLQYGGKYFESKTYKDKDGNEFKYTVEIKNVPYNNNTVLILTGYENGSPFTREYQQNGFTMGKGDDYSGMNSVRVKNSSVALSLKFYNEENGGWVNATPANGSTIKLALKNK